MRAGIESPLPSHEGRGLNYLTTYKICIWGSR
jgi:hypothetical protein